VRERAGKHLPILGGALWAPGPMDTNTDELRQILLRAFPGCRVDTLSELGGGISARPTRADLVLADGTTRRVVLRRPRLSWPDEASKAAECEYRLLTRCAALGIPAPRPLFHDVAASALVLEYLEGAPELAPTDTANVLRQMAATLALIHGASDGAGLEFLDRRADSAARTVSRRPAELDATLEEPRLRAALDDLWPWEQKNPDALLHGDYWPGNLLFENGTLAAVLDWEEPEVGDPLADVALARLDVLWVFGEEGMHAFTRFYRELTQLDWDNLARWDLLIALRPMSNLHRWAQSYAPIGRPDVTELSMREGHRRFVRQALESLGRG